MGSGVGAGPAVLHVAVALEGDGLRIFSGTAGGEAETFAGDVVNTGVIEGTRSAR